MMNISVINDKAYVWNAEDVHILRANHRIIGTLIGCLPRAPRQNQHLGLPLELMPEEATLIREKGFGMLIDKSKEPPSPTEEEVQFFEDLNKQAYEAQCEQSMKERREYLLSRKHEILEARQKTKAKRKRKASAWADGSEAAAEFDVDKEVASYTLPEEKSCVVLHTAYPQRENETYDEVAWTFPASDMEKLRYRAFRDMYDRGYCLTSGAKFGGHFIVYPGDPSRCHSWFIVNCVLRGTKLTGADIATMGRLATGVKKTYVICSVDSNDKLTYKSISWSGIS